MKLRLSTDSLVSPEPGRPAKRVTLRAFQFLLALFLLAGSGGESNGSISTLVLTKEFTNDPVAPGDTVTLEFTITNQDLIQSATSITFTDDLDATLPGLVAIGLPLNDVCGAGSVLSGTSLLTLTGGTLLPSTSCTFSVTLQVPPNANMSTGHFNITSFLSAELGGSPMGFLPASDSLLVGGGVDFTKSFVNDPVLPGSTVELEFTFTNENTASSAFSMSFTDDLDAALPGLTALGLPQMDLCQSGDLLSGTSELSYENGGVETTCTISVVLQIPADATPGVYLNMTSLLNYGVDAVDIPNLTPATDTLVILGPLTLAKSFADNPAEPGDLVTLDFTVTNPNTTEPATGITFVDNLPMGLTAVGLPASDVCGLGSQLTGTSSITLTGGSLLAGASCVFSVTVAVDPSLTDGFLFNTTDILSATVAGFLIAGGTATDSLQIIAPTATPTSTVTETSTETATPTVTETSTGTATETPTETVTETGTETATPTSTVTETETPEPTATPTATESPTETITETPTSTITETPTETITETATETVTETPTSTITETPTETITETPTETITETPTSTITETPSQTITETESETPTETVTQTVTSTSTETATETPTETPTATATETSTVTVTETSSPTATATSTSTETPTATTTLTATASATPTETATTPPTSTVTATPVCDPGAYLLSSDGSIFELGDVPNIDEGNIPAVIFGADIEAVDRADVKGGSGGNDLALLDGSGVVSFINSPGLNIPQDFIFPGSEEFPNGRAVDLSFSDTNEGFWVLTDFGGIYRAGDVKDASDPALVPGTGSFGLGYDIPLGALRDPAFPANGDSLRAVGFVVIDEETPIGRAEGYVIVDSMGGRYLVNVTASGHPMLDESLVWPFFPGLDIARDVDLHPSGQGVGVLDGWGGIHPVPVDDPAKPVFFLRNEDPANPGTQITTLGMPYVVAGIDNPTTPEDESDPTVIGMDVASIFVDFHFSAACFQGFYALDRFGGVYAFGQSRANPGSLSPSWATPFLPTLTGMDLEVMGRE